MSAKSKVITVTIQPEDYDFLNEYSKEKTGSENRSLAIRMLINDRRNNRCACNTSVIDSKTVK